MQPHSEPIGLSSFGKEAIDTKPAQDSPQIECDDRQLNYLDMQLKALIAQAIELEQQAIRAACTPGEDDATDEIETAKQHAQCMRATADQIGCELGTAPIDKQTGKRRIASSRVATLVTAIEHVLHASEREKTSLAEAVSEHHKTATRRSLAKPVAAVAAAVKAPLIVQAPLVTHVPLLTPSSPITVSASGVGVPIGQRLEQWVGTIQQVGSSIMESKPVTAAVEYGSRIVQATVNFTKDTADSVVESAQDAASKVVSSAKRGYSWIVGKATDGIKYAAGLFTSGEKQGVSIVQPAPLASTPKENSGFMARALAQAAAVTMPIASMLQQPIASMLQQPIDSLMQLSPPNLPQLQTGFASLVGFP